MLGRGHQAGVDGDIGIDLDAADSKSERLEELLNKLSEASVAPPLLRPPSSISETNQTSRGSDNSLSHAYDSRPMYVSKIAFWIGRRKRK